jgi:1,2-phenylacetyl-CoA epoxidase catalytic subunit
MTQPQDEELRQLLRRIIESLAWRQIALINIIGHCLKYVTDLETKVRMATELGLSLRLFREVRELHGELGWEDLERAVRERVDRIPFPQSRLEFGVATYLFNLGEMVAMKSYIDSASPRFAAVARTYVEATQSRPRPTRFVEFASDPANRPQAQQYLSRWLTIASQSFGRPDTMADRRSIELGLRSRGSAEMRDLYHAEVRAFVKECGLAVPPLAEPRSGVALA